MAKSRKVNRLAKRISRQVLKQLPRQRAVAALRASLPPSVVVADRLHASVAKCARVFRQRIYHNKRGLTSDQILKDMGDSGQKVLDALTAMDAATTSLAATLQAKAAAAPAASQAPATAPAQAAPAAPATTDATAK
jgi:hypothetical protein